MNISDIPRGDLESIIVSMAWYDGDRKEFDGKHGFSFDVCEETAIRDVVYRNEPLYGTPEEALIAHWERHYAASK